MGGCGSCFLPVFFACLWVQFVGALGDGVGCVCKGGGGDSAQ